MRSVIKWRVLSVSACYSGVFLDPSSTDSTFIATASIRRTFSFGCADEPRPHLLRRGPSLKDSIPTTARSDEAFKKAATSSSIA